MYCPYCRTTLPEGARFCAECGKPIPAPSRTSSGSPLPKRPSTPPPPVSSRSSSEERAPQGPKRPQRPAVPGAPHPNFQPASTSPSPKRPSSAPKKDVIQRPETPRAPGIPKPPAQPPPPTPADETSSPTSLPRTPRSGAESGEAGTRVQDPGDWGNVTPPGTAVSPQVSLPHAITLVLIRTNAPYTLTGKTDYLIGREDAEQKIFPDLDLSLSGGEEGGVSRRHARIYYRNHAYWIEDQDSLNYTFVNGRRLKPYTPHRLHDNDELSFGNVHMRFHSGQPDVLIKDWGHGR